MKYLFHVLLGFASTLGAVLAEPEAGEQGVAFQSLPLHSTDDQLHYVLPMMVEGKDALFLLDTGCAYSSVVSLKLAKDLGKDLGKEETMSGIGGDSMAYLVPFSEFKLGRTYGVKFKQTRVTELPNLGRMRLKGEPVEIGGLVGSQTLMAISGVVDFGEERILVPPRGAPKGTYRSSMKDQGAVVLALKQGFYAYPMVVVTLGGEEFVFLIDSAATCNLIEPAVFAALGLEKSGTAAKIVGKGSGAASDVPKTIAKDVRVAGRLQVVELEFVVLPTMGGKLVEKGQTYGGILGSPFLIDRKAQIDFGTYSLILPRTKEDD